MKKIILNFLFLVIAMGLASCSTTTSLIQKIEKKVSFESKESMASNNTQKSMDVNDKAKMFQALDKALGKSTQWDNPITGISYTVVPTKKIVVDGNAYCRNYTITTVKNKNTKVSSGTACVSAADSSWQIIN